MKQAIIAVLLLLNLTFPAMAAGNCYSADEVQAEQFLRLHSELMVITVTCKYSSDGDDLVKPYTTFTNTHVAALRNAEQVMARYYQKRYGGDGMSQVDKLRTKLANEFGQSIANVSAPLFCAQRRDKVMKMYDARTSTVNEEVAQMCTDTLTYVPACDGKLRVARKN